MFDHGPTPDDPMELLKGELLGPTIHIYNDKDHATPWICKDTDLGRVLVPLDELPNRTGVVNPPYAGYWDPAIPPMKPEVLDQALAFFRFVFETNHSEAALLLAIDEARDYHLYCPEQEVDYTGVDWKDTVLLADDHYLIGSIHSHCDFSAFHSGTDTGDAAKNDGLHITLGKVDEDTPEIDVMISFSGVRWTKWDHTTFMSSPWTPRPAKDQAQDELFPIDWIDELKDPLPMFPVKKAGSSPKTHYPQSYQSPNKQHAKWDSYEWDSDYFGWDQYESLSVDKYDPNDYGFIPRIDAKTNWYSPNPEMAADQVIKDLTDLIAIAQNLELEMDWVSIIASLSPKETPDARPHAS